MAYLFSRDQGGVDAWGLTKTFAPSDTPDYTWLGTAVATDGTRTVIGSAWEDGAGTNRGAVHVLGRDQDGAGSWGEIKKLTASDARDDDLFGYSLALEGDYIVVGAGWNKGGGTERGQAYLFGRDDELAWHKLPVKAYVATWDVNVYNGNARRAGRPPY